MVRRTNCAEYGIVLCHTHASRTRTCIWLPVRNCAVMGTWVYANVSGSNVMCCLWPLLGTRVPGIYLLAVSILHGANHHEALLTHDRHNIGGIDLVVPRRTYLDRQPTNTYLLDINILILPSRVIFSWWFLRLQQYLQRLYCGVGPAESQYCILPFIQSGAWHLTSSECLSETSPSSFRYGVSQLLTEFADGILRTLFRLATVRSSDDQFPEMLARVSRDC